MPQIGSSPRVRGTASWPRPADQETRFIPACAGNRPWRLDIEAQYAVHPRVCGEQIQFAKGRTYPAGSSPRVRGTVVLQYNDGERERFIPACAGNSGFNIDMTSASTVHPRVCGEQRRASNTKSTPAGSSPRVRGTDLEFRLIERPRRFIPACAGNSRSPRFSRQKTAVHPRVCGEQSISARLRRLANGSSPRVRGTALMEAGTPRIWRFIPACAGNSIADYICVQRLTVHPRVCGEQVLSCFNLLPRSGSSPRVRGTVYAASRRNDAARFIPACAGNRRWCGGGGVM